MDTLILTIFILLLDIVFIVIGTILWYLIWVRQYGCSIPNKRVENIQTYFNSKNLKMVISQLYARIFEFDKEYITSTCGFEAYAYLVFQRHTIQLLVFTIAVSFIFSSISAIVTLYDAKNFSVLLLLNQICFQNKASTDYASIFHVTIMIALILFQIRFLTSTKRELKYLYFARYDKMSRDKNYEWLSCRTLHISGIAPYERNVNLLKTKINFFLSNQQIKGLGSVVEVNFIPDYKELLKLEIKKENINDLKKLVPYSENSWYRRFFFPKELRNEYEINKALKDIDKSIDEECEKIVYSSGHAFVSFNSLKSAYTCLKVFKEDAFKALALKFRELKDSRTFDGKNSLIYNFSANFTDKFNNNSIKKKINSNKNISVNLGSNQLNDNINNETNHNDIEFNLENDNSNYNKKKKQPKYFSKKNYSSFKDEQEEEIAVINNNFKLENVNIQVDQMIEPSDIIWKNIGGDRGVNYLRQIMCSVLMFLILIFATTPTVLFSAIKSIVYSEDYDLDWIHNPVIDFIKTYSPPIAILMLNQMLLILIDFMIGYEKHYTLSRMQNSVFRKTYFYFIMNMLIIPGFTLSTAHSLFDIFIGNKELTIKNISNTFSNMYISDNGMFFVNLIIQNAVFSYIYYLLRIDELTANSFSTFVTFYKRYFTNNGKPYHRKPEEIFQYGYFYAQMLTILSISIVFASNVPFVGLVALFYFFCRHISDFLSLLMVHRIEMDSCGMLVSYLN